MKNPFNEKMSDRELDSALFRECEGKTPEERKALLDLWRPLMRVKLREQMKLADEGWLLG